MDILYISLRTTFPLLLIMTIGFIGKKKGVIDDVAVTNINSLVYWILLPILLFCNIYQPNLYTIMNLKLFVYIIGMTLVVILGAFILAPTLVSNVKQRGIVIQGAFRGNIIYFGIPVVTELLGAEYAGLVSVMMIAIVPIYNIVSVLALEKYAKGEANLKEVLSQIIKNPLIITSLLAMMAILLNLHLPEILMDPLRDVSKASTPVALILLGAAIEMKKSLKEIRLALIIMCLKLVIIPIIAIVLAMVLGFTTVELVVIFAIFVSPTAIASYSLAKEMNSEYDLAAQIVFLTTCGSVLTIFTGSLLIQYYLM